MTTLRIALYLRVSTRDQNFRAQEKVLRDYCARRGWKNLTVYREKKSRDDDSRAVMHQVMTDAREGKLDVVLVYKLDRWGSSIIHVIQTVRELATRKVAFVTATEGLDTSNENPTAELQLSVMSWLAAVAVKRIRDCTRDGLAAAAKRGRYPGRPAMSSDKIAAALKLRGKKKQTEIAKLTGLSTGYISQLFNGRKLKGKK